MTTPPVTPPRRFLGVTTTVFAAGIVSFLMDVSSEMMVPVMPLFITGVLGMSAATLGLIEGLAEATASLVKVWSGRRSDRGARKPWALVGYGLSALARPLIAVAWSWPTLLGARLVDRAGKGIRTAPRDALIAAATPIDELGRAFGVHRGLDTLGAAVGPLVAFAALAVLSYRGLFWLATIPAVLSVLAMIVFVREDRGGIAARQTATEAAFPRDPRILLFLAAMGVYALGNSSDAFLFLRVRDLGVPVVALPLVSFTFNIVYAAVSAPAGLAADYWGRGRVARWGLLVFALVYAGFGLARAAGRVGSSSPPMACSWPLRKGSGKRTSVSLPRTIPAVRSMVRSMRSWAWRRSPPASSPGGSGTWLATAHRSTTARAWPC